MKKKYLTLLAVAVLVSFLFPALSTAKEPAVAERAGWLLGIIFKLENMRDKEIANIRKYDAEIQKSNATIRAAEDLVTRAQQKGNTKAERIAREALATAREAKRKNEELRSLAEARKTRAETAYARVYNRLSKETGGKEEIRGVVSGVSGNVFILSQRDKETIPLAGDRAGYLSPGDEIWTSENSSAEIQILYGRGSLRLGEHSRLKVEQDSAATQAINLMNGKIHVAIDKMDEFEKMANKMIRAYGEDVKTIGGELRSTFDRAIFELQREIAKFKRNFEVRTPIAVCAVRGTELLVFEDQKGTEIMVLEGSVEVKGAKGGETIIANAGQKATVTRDGILSGPERIDLSKIERWWDR